MSTRTTLVDALGQSIGVGDKVIFTHASDGLLKGLPSEDQRAIRAQQGKTLTITGFNSQGNPELEFVDENGIRHSIWVENRNVRRVN